MTYKRDVTLDLTFKDGNVHCGVLQTAEGMYDVSGESIEELVADAKALAEYLGITIDVFNLEYPVND